MPIPNLLHPVPITAQIVDKAKAGSTFFDDDLREPIQQAVRSADITLSGQVKQEMTDEQRPSFVGSEQAAEGYVLFRLIDLANHPQGPITLKQNDRFTKLGSVVVDVHVIGLRYVGHYPDQVGPTMVKAFYADRQPAKGVSPNF